jgi:hypothetical protein
MRMRRKAEIVRERHAVVKQLVGMKRINSPEAHLLVGWLDALSWVLDDATKAKARRGINTNGLIVKDGSAIGLIEELI